MRNHFYDLPEVLQQKILHSKAKQEARDVVQATDISMLIGFVNLGTQQQRQIAAWKLWGLGHVAENRAEIAAAGGASPLEYRHMAIGRDGESDVALF